MSIAVAPIAMYMSSNCQRLMWMFSMLAPGMSATCSSSMFCSVTVHFSVHAIAPDTAASAAGSRNEVMMSSSESAMMTIAKGDMNRFVSQK